MPGYASRKIDSVMGDRVLGGSTPSGMMNMGQNLLAQRRLRQDKPKPVVTKPVLSTTAQKEAEMKRLLTTKWLPPSMRLAKLRQLAGHGQILGKQARDFMSRSAAGKKLESSESILKFEKELLTAARELTANKPGRSPIKYEFRKGGEAKLEQQAKQMLKGLRQEVASQAKPEQPTTDPVMERRARLADLYNRIKGNAGTAAPAPAKVLSHGPGLGGTGTLMTGGGAHATMSLPTPSTPTSISTGAADTSSPVGQPAIAQTRALFVGKGIGPAEASEVSSQTGFRLDAASVEQLIAKELAFDIYRLILIEDLPANPNGVHPVNPNDLTPARCPVIIFSTNCPADRKQDWLNAGASDVRNETITPEIARLILVRLLGPSHVMTYERPHSFVPAPFDPTTPTPPPAGITPLGVH